MVLEIAGVAISGLSLLHDLYAGIKGARDWPHADLVVDKEWLSVALKSRLLDGDLSDYAWAKAERVARLEMKKERSIVVAPNKEKRTIYRIVRGGADSRLVLMKRLPATTAA